MADTQVNTFENLSLNELGAFKDIKIAELETYFKSHTKDGQIVMDADEVEIVRMKNKEITEATKRWENLREMDEVFKQTVEKHAKANTVNRQVPFIVDDKGGFQPSSAFKSIGEIFTDSPVYKSHKGLHDGQPHYQYTIGESLDMRSLKTLMTTSAGFAPPNDRTTVVVNFALRRPTVADLVPTDATTLTSVKYMEETTWGTASTNANPAAAVAEGDPKPEAEMEWTEV